MGSSSFFKFCNVFFTPAARGILIIKSAEEYSWHHHTQLAIIAQNQAHKISRSEAVLRYFGPFWTSLRKTCLAMGIECLI